MPDEKKILLVDDEKEIIQSLENFFSQKGYKISVALDGEKALKRLSQEEPDLVVLDMKMPNVDGIEVLKHLKESHPLIKTVALTGFAEDYKEEAQKLGVEAFLTKPYSLERLIYTIENLLSGRELILDKYISSFTEDFYIIAKARVLIYPPNALVYGNIAAHLRKAHYSGGMYELEAAYNTEELFKKIDSFKPDIVLVDMTYFGLFKNLTKDIFQQSHLPKDLIVFGTPSSEDIESFKAKKAVDGLFDPLSTSFNKESMRKLADILRNTCIQHGLYERWEKRWDVDYEKQKEEELQQKKKGDELSARRSDFENMPDAVNKILAKHLNINQWHIHPDGELDKMTNSGKLAKVSAIVEIEEYFGLNIPEEELEKINTVAEIYKCLAKIVFNRDWK